MRRLVCDQGDDSARYVLDASPIGKAERMPNGFLRAPATLTRVGVFEYRFADGTTRREFRPPEEVFNADSLASLRMAPLTLEHPEPIGTPVTADNSRQLSVGHLSDTIEREGDMVRADLMITDAKAVRQVEKGERQEISLGYWREIDPTPGVWRGTRYDAVQRNIRYNHAAITRKGRAGPEVRIRLDSETAVLVGDAEVSDDSPTPGASEMKFKLTIDGITHEIECAESSFQAISKGLGDRDKRIEALDSQVSEARKLVDEAKARADQAEAEGKKLKQQVTDAISPERVAELVEKRMDLEREAGPLLNADKADKDKIDLSKLEDDEIRRQVILLADADAELKDVSRDYLHARYDATVKFLSTDSAKGKRQVAADSRNAVRKASGQGAPIAKKSEEARKRMIADTHAAWRKGLDEDDGDEAAEA